MKQKIKVVITGATGMVGEGVLHECLNHPDVESVLVINRKPCDVQHEKLKEIIHANFYDLSSIESELSGYNTCFFCLGVSSLGMKEDAYKHITYDLTMYVANTLLKLNLDMIFCYISGSGTDSSEQGLLAWARIKGETENDLLKLGFKSAYMFRPGYIQPIKGLKNTYKIYRVFSPLYPVWKTLFSKFVCTLEDLGLAMINAVTKDYSKSVLECPDITNLAKK